MHDRAHADDGVLADPYSGQDDRATAEPHVRTDVDRFRRLPLVASEVRVDGVRRCEQLHVRADLDVVADGDGCDVERDEPEVREGPGADADPGAVVAEERWTDLAPRAELGEELVEDATTFVGLVGEGPVEHVLEPAGPQ